MEIDITIGAVMAKEVPVNAAMLCGSVSNAFSQSDLVVTSPSDNKCVGFLVNSLRCYFC